MAEQGRKDGRFGKAPYTHAADYIQKNTDRHTRDYLGELMKRLAPTPLFYIQKETKNMYRLDMHEKLQGVEDPRRGP